MMRLPVFVMERLSTLDPPNRDSIVLRMREMYERPIDFFRSFIGVDMHYHLGHFPTQEVSLNEGMRNAVDSLIEAADDLVSHPRLLDIGCGWGGPAEQLISRLGASVVCVTASARQARFTRRRLKRTTATVYALDAEKDSILGSGPFDVIWMYESFEHMLNPGRVLRTLRGLIAPQGKLLIATACSGDATHTQLYSTHLGVQPLGTIADLRDLLFENDWCQVQIIDRTDLTLPSWEKWRTGLRQMRGGLFSHEAERLELEFNVAEPLYEVGLLRSVHVVATPAKRGQARAGQIEE